MKNKAIQLMIAKQYNVNEKDVNVEFIAHDSQGYEFKVRVLDKEASGQCGAEMYQTNKITVKSKPWVEDPFVM